MTRYLAAFSLWLLISMSSNALAESPLLRVAIAADNAPLAYVADGKAVGMEVDLARMLQVELGAQLQLQSMPAAEVAAALERGQADIAMAGLVITPELEKRVDFARPYLHSGEMAIIRTDDVMRFRGPASLLQDSLKVGFVAGSAGENYVKSTMSRAAGTSCLSADECLQALLARRIDVFIGSPALSWGLATNRQYGALMSLYRPLTEEHFAWAVAKGNDALRDRLDEALERMQQMQMFEHILNRWIPVRIGSD